MKTFLACLAFTFLAVSMNVTGQDNTAEKHLRNFQVSVIPFLGSDGTEVINNRYRVSINLLGGVTGGIEGFEAGSILNITSGSVKGIQLSGFGNAVRDDFQGFQGAGFFNATGGKVNAFMGAGFINITGDSFNGFAGAGFANISGGDMIGAKGAGFANISGGGMIGFSGAGFANIAGGNSEGAQMAGFMNISRNFSGIQASGFLNVVSELEGIQLGIINISDSVSKGIPVGLINIVKRGGLRQLELAFSDASHMTVSFRLGVPYFYNIFSYSIRHFSGERFRGFGYGLGTGFSLSEEISMQMEMHSTQLHNNFRIDSNELDLLNEARMNVSYSATGRISFFGGVVLYNQYSKDDPESGIRGREIAPSRILAESKINGYTSRWWPGFRAGARVSLF